MAEQSLPTCIINHTPHKEENARRGRSMDTDNFGLDLDKVRNKLNKLNNYSNRDNYLWKPDADSQKIRVVPYKHQKDFPFIELQWHYDLPGQSVISPASFGEPDPVVEFAQELRDAGGNENWELSKKLMPKTRTYVPVIVRGEEDMGVRFYGFGVTIFRRLLSFLDDEDFGNFIDPAKGNDLKVEYTPRAKSNTNYPQTEIKLLPKQRPITEDKEQLRSFFEDQKKIEEVFSDKIATYDDLKQTLERFRDASFDMETLQENVRGSSSNGSSGASKGSSEQKGGDDGGTDVDDLEAELDSYFDDA